MSTNATNQNGGDESDGGNSRTGTAPRSVFMHRLQLSTVSKEIVGLVYSVQDLDIQAMESAMTGEQVKHAFAEMYPPATLFDISLRSIPTVYTNLRDWLNSKGANLRQHSSRRVMMTLATSLYDEAEDREAAITIATEIIADGRRSRRNTDTQHSNHNTGSNGTQRTTLSGSSGNTEQVAHRIAMRFKDDSAKFSGSIGECWGEFVAEYQQVARDYNLTESHKKQFLHNLVRGDAKRFYLNQVQTYTTTFAASVQMVESEYNSVVRQNRVKNYLNSLRLNKFIVEGADELSALEKVYKLIIKLSPQVPQSHRGEAHKTEFLRNATVGAAWATEPLSRIATHNLTFQEVYGELEAALHLNREAKMAEMRDKVSLTNSENKSNGDVPGILYKGQGRYHFKKTGIGNRNRQWKADATRKLNDSKGTKTRGCFNCGDREHLIKDCPYRIDIRRAANRRIEFYAEKKGKLASTYLVMNELCDQLDAEPDVEHEDSTDLESNPGLQEHEAHRVSTVSVGRDPVEDFNLFESLVSYTEEIYAAPEETDPEKFIVEINYTPDNNSPNEFQGGCLDIGASRSLIGRRQAEAYHGLIGLPLVLIPNSEGQSIFKFGSDRQRSIGKCCMRIPYANYYAINMKVDVVNVDIPLLIGLDVLDKYYLYCNNVRNELVCEDPVWSHPITRKLGHLYYVWEHDVMYTMAEL